MENMQISVHDLMNEIAVAARLRDVDEIAFTSRGDGSAGGWEAPPRMSGREHGVGVCIELISTSLKVELS